MHVEKKKKNLKFCTDTAGNIIHQVYVKWLTAKANQCSVHFTKEANGKVGRNSSTTTHMSKTMFGYDISTGG